MMAPCPLAAVSPVRAFLKSIRALAATMDASFGLTGAPCLEHQTWRVEVPATLLDRRGLRIQQLVVPLSQRGDRGLSTVNARADQAKLDAAWIRYVVGAPYEIPHAVRGHSCSRLGDLGSATDNTATDHRVNFRGSVFGRFVY